MNYRQLGRSGLRISELSLGSWVTYHNQVDLKASMELMAAAYDHGVNFFDNAEAYAGGKSEEIMGDTIRKLGWRRGSYLVSTKVFWGLHDTPLERNTLSRKYLIEATNGSLKRFELEYVDLLYCHRDDPDTPIEEIVFAMHSIIEQGKALYWGTSEWEPARIIEAIEFAEQHSLHKPIVEQPIYNLLAQHRFAASYDEVYLERGYGSTIWSPLASGLLTGKYQQGIPEGSRGSVLGMEWLQNELTDSANLDKVAALQPIAEEMGATLAQFSIAWCLQNPNVSSVITGASRVEQLQQNMKALDFIDKLTPDVMTAIEAALT